MKVLRLIVRIFIIQLTMYSCNKNTEQCGYSSNCFAGRYKITGLTMQSSSDPGVYNCFNDPSCFDACQKDDEWVFNPDGTYFHLEGANVCTPSQAENGTWAISGGYYIITVNGVRDSSAILSMNCDSFTVKDVFTGTGGSTITAIGNYVKL